MGTVMSEDPSLTDHLLRRAAAGDEESWGALLTRHGERLRRMIALRMDPRLHGRIDPEDVVQEAYLEAWQHLAEYLRQPPVPFFLWLRGIAGNKLRELHRHHLGAQMRDAGREVSLYRGGLPEATSAALAAQLLGHLTRPSEAAVRAEVKIRLQEALNSMDALDREVLALRHFEQLSPAETAQVLGIKEKAAGMR
jgi:RNA polymerase sigma-70 factor (ECF subfamily)